MCCIIVYSIYIYIIFWYDIDHLGVIWLELQAAQHQFILHIQADRDWKLGLAAIQLQFEGMLRDRPSKALKQWGFNKALWYGFSTTKR